MLLPSGQGPYAFTEVSTVQSAKEYVPIDFKEPGREIVESEEQFLNPSFPIVSTEPKSIEFKLVQEKNEAFPIVLTEFGILTLLTLKQL